MEVKMSKYQITIIVGSLRKDSFNRKLANAIIKLASEDFFYKESQISDCTSNA